MAKYQEIAQLLRHQLERGEYPGGKVPPLRKLAVSMGVSYLTARQAVKTFKEAGWDETKVGRPFVAMVTPLWAFTEWHRAIRNQTQEFGGRVSFIAYGSETDPVIYDAINQEQYDLIILFLPDREDPRLIELISKAKDRIVVMFRDLTQYGIRCLEGADPFCIEKFLEILKERGVRRIDAIGRDTDLTSPRAIYYQVWRNWLERNGLEGRLFNIKHCPFEHEDIKTTEMCRDILAKKELADAVFCFTPTMAAGIYRACYEHGIVPGRDISIFGFGDQERAKLMTPALATVQNVDIPGTVRKLIKEYCPGAKRSSRLAFRLENTDIFLGESIIP